MAASYGAATHQALASAVQIKTGPLYFHLRHLERAGFMKIHARDRYEMTRAGRDFLVIVVAAVNRIGRSGLRPTRGR